VAMKVKCKMEKPVVLSLDEECLLVDEGGGHEGD
jgi:hypothetical protein